ncbi:KilA-N domain-containing protein [Candidatus Halobeggiatoa sp. HSG11]|nr:KilA-N domain-containing protein [Candidatus Halobeggiatoa sp. HSG11]
MKKSTKFELVYKEKSIRQDGDFICLTDLWIASEKPKGKCDPRRWKKEAGQDFIDAVAKNLNVSIANVYKTTRGCTGATYAHSEIAEAYQLYLGKKVSPKYQIEKDVKNALIKKLQKIYGTEVKTEIAIETGFLDILTPKELIEVKNSKDWKAAVGQILIYGLSFPDRKKRIHLFDKKIENVLELSRKLVKNLKLLFLGILIFINSSLKRWQ